MSVLTIRGGKVLGEAKKTKNKNVSGVNIRTFILMC